MGATQQALLMASGGGFTAAQLVLEALFSSGTTTTPNTGSIGGVLTIANVFGTRQASGGAVDGGGYLQYAYQYDGSSECDFGVSGADVAKLTIGTADFDISMYARFRNLNNRWGFPFWTWRNGAPQAYLQFETITGRLLIVDGAALVADTGYVGTADNTWRKYKLKRTAGVVYVEIDNVAIFSTALTTNMQAGSFSTQELVLGGYFVGGTTSAGFSDADIDQFRFYNGNV